MAKLINADALKKYFPKDEDWEYPVNTNEYVCECIDAQPTVDAIPISYLAEEYTLIMKILKWRHDISREYREELKREAKYMKGWINHYRYEQGLGFNGWLWKALTDEELAQMVEEEHDTAD